MVVGLGHCIMSTRPKAYFDSEFANESRVFRFDRRCPAKIRWVDNNTCKIKRYIKLHSVNIKVSKNNTSTFGVGEDLKVEIELIWVFVNTINTR